MLAFPFPPVNVAVFCTQPFERDFLRPANADRHHLQLLDAGLGVNTVPLAQGSLAGSGFTADEVPPAPVPGAPATLPPALTGKLKEIPAVRGPDWRPAWHCPPGQLFHAPPPAPARRPIGVKRAQSFNSTIYAEQRFKGHDEHHHLVG